MVISIPRQPFSHAISVYYVSVRRVELGSSAEPNTANYCGFLIECRVTHCKLVRDKFTGLSLGYAYLSFENDEQVR